MRRRSTTGTRRHGVVDVELVEVDGTAPDPTSLLSGPGGWTDLPATGDAAGAVDPADPEQVRDAQQARGRRRRRWAVTAIGACAVLAWGALGAVVESRQEANRLATLAESPGILPPLTEPLTPAWTVDGAWVSGQIGDLVLLGSMSDSSTRAVDVRTGAVRWTYDPAATSAEVDSSYCMPLHELGPDGLPLPPQPGQGLPLLVCQWNAYDDDLGGWMASATTVEVLDPADGTVVSALDGTANLLLDVQVRHGGLVVASATLDGYVLATRWSTDSWTPEWSYQSPEPLLGEGLSMLRGISSDNGVLRVEGQGVLALSLDTGREVPYAAEEGVGPGVTTTLPDGGTAVWTYGTRGAGSGQVLDADGSVRFELTGPPVPVPVYDGSDPDLLVVMDGNQSVAVVEAATGRELWSLGVSGYPIAQVDGVLVVGDSTVVHAVDVRDGSPVWELPSGASGFGTGMSDGEVVLVPGEADGAPYLGAYAIVDGSERWRTPLPAGTTWVSRTQDGLIIAGTDGSVTLMR